MIKNLVIAKWISVAFILCTLIGCASLDWPIIKATDKIEYYELYLREYPNSEYAPQAQKRIGELYEEAKSVKAITTYEDFLQKYPNSEYAPEVSNRLELLHFENAKSLRTIGNYRDFLQKYPSSKYAGELSQNLQELEKEVYNIEIATKKVLPEEVNIEVTTISQFHDEPEFVITGHLLKGHSADDSDPYVRGDYGTREKLTRLVQLRCANIIQSVAKDALPSKIASLTVSCKHGVRTLFDRGDFIGSDSTTIVYKVGVSGDVLRDKNIESMGAESVIKLCDVYTNIIPDLDFLPDTRPPGLRSKR